MERFRSILAVLTEDSLAEVALARAIGLARAHGAALTLVDAVAIAPGEIGRMLQAVSGRRGPEIEEDVLAYHRDRIAAMAQTARSAGIEVTEAVLQGVPFVEIIRMVLREGHDLVVKGATLAEGGRGALRGADMHLLRKCPCPVWILADAEAQRTRRVLAAVDPGEPGDALRAGLDARVLSMAAHVAELDGADLHVVHAWSLEVERALRHGRDTGRRVDVDALVSAAEAEGARRLAESLGPAAAIPAPRRHLRHGPAGEAVVAAVRDIGADLLVMGSVGRSGISGLVMGNTAESILTAAPCSVLALKPEGFETPVRLEGS